MDGMQMRRARLRLQLNRQDPLEIEVGLAGTPSLVAIHRYIGPPVDGVRADQKNERQAPRVDAAHVRHVSTANAR
ncbi:hypothetical protein D9M68_965730 [compost metagenome]